MAYELGSATDLDDLLIKLRIFAVAQGWTVNRDVVAGSGRELCISKGSAYFNLRSLRGDASFFINGSAHTGRHGMVINGSDGYSAGAAWDQQPGYPLRSAGGAQPQGHAVMALPVFTGPFPSYHFFTPNANCIFAEVEVASTIYQRIGFGSLDLFNGAAPGGGRFFYSTGGRIDSTIVNTVHWLGNEVDNSSSALEEVPFRHADYSTASTNVGSWLRAAFGAYDNWYSSGRNATSTYASEACQGGGVHDKVLRDYSPNPLNGLGILLPNIVSLNQGDQFLMPVGVIPGMRYMDMTRYQPGEEFTLGPDTWKVFPWYQKGGRTWQRGIAYQKIV